MQKLIAHFFSAARIPWRITQVPGYTFVVIVMLSVAKLRRFGMLHFLYCKWDCTCADAGPMLCTCVFKASHVWQTLSDLTFGRSASLSSFYICFGIIFSALL